MASSQAVNDKSQNELVQKMIEKSKSIASSNENAAVSSDVKQSQQQGAVVSMFNATKAPVAFNTKNDWTGYIIGPYPTDINSNNSGSFTHAGVDRGSWSAVVYYGFNDSAVPCGWLLAWLAPTNESSGRDSNRVYVECGPTSKYANIDWNFIRAMLSDQPDNYNYYDPTTRTSISATITNMGSYAVVGASIAAA